MKRMGLLVSAAVVALTAYNTWQIRKLAIAVDRRRAEASAASRLEQALAHTRRARTLLNKNDAREATAELDHAIRDVTVVADHSRQNGRSMVLAVREGFNRAAHRVRAVLKGKKKPRRA
jgi:hypothetical protein